MNKKALEYFARCAIEDVFSEDPEYICNTLFEGSWEKMYDHITEELSSCTSIQFPDPEWTGIAVDWTGEDYDEHHIFMCERWEHLRMSEALKEAWSIQYWDVKHALEAGITLEDLQ